MSGLTQADTANLDDSPLNVIKKSSREYQQEQTRFARNEHFAVLKDQVTRDPGIASPTLHQTFNRPDLPGILSALLIPG